ncbi:hypothetical protein CDO44_11350 [Pigmentiphaga sp. NML080357]|uniref:amidohydrolase family protein n=1 Tax=Pigmentiphaga sp. NML080357 TaxID=2008675 RepID=UPI000B41B059|nr:amidohydrolase [Pigmentiphaga sp. NML080357]OVZ59716.1 hypothetical protein CDO44_11350 [Pigmentiphaga sp. NML080357]
MTRTLIENGVVLTMNPAGDIHEDGCVLVEDSRLAYVGPRGGLPRELDARREDAAGRVVMPGLVNCHTHLCMIFGRTLATNTDLLSWLDLQMPVMRALDAEAMLAAQTLGCVENLKNGNTTLVENLFAPRSDTVSPEDCAFAAMERTGIRGTVARAFEALRFDPAFVETPAQQAERVRALHARWHGSAGGRLRLSFGPLLPWTLDESMLRASRALAGELGLCLHMHVAESAEFNRIIERHYGRPVRNVELLHETGCLGPDVQAVGVSDLSPREVALLAETGTSVILDPQTRLFWGTGFPPLAPFLDAGITCGLATNGPAANCGQDLFESMKYACATAKTAAGDPRVLDARRALRMATVEGARALGLDGQVGSLETGKQADLITIDLRQPHLVPAFDLEAALVFSARGSDVRDAMVDGQWLMRDRCLTRIDEPALLARAETLAERSLERAHVRRGHHRTLKGTP